MKIRFREKRCGLLGHLLLSLSIAPGCSTIHSMATGTSYCPYNSLTGGYSETVLSPDVVDVVMRGNSSTKREQAKNIALLRAAELSLASGVSIFFADK